MRTSIAMTLAVAAGCTWGGPPALVVTGVETSVTPVLRGASVLVTVTGGGFEPDVTVDFDHPARSAVCGALRVQLRDGVHAPVELLDLRVVSRDALSGRLPGDVAKATWDVVVFDAEGREASLPGAIAVENCPSSPPNSPCDDGDECTFDPAYDPADKCTGAAACTGASARPDDYPCRFRCTTEASVEGVCLGGRCVPNPGLCDPPLRCDAP